MKNNAINLNFIQNAFLAASSVLFNAPITQKTVICVNKHDCMKRAVHSHIIRVCFTNALWQKSSIGLKILLWFEDLRRF